MSKGIRLRFAPSPTGALHIGGLRTALYNYLLAKKSGGQFILRIEDTDQTRFVPGAEQYIIDCLKWANLIPDEGVGFGGNFGPYRQSERTEIYRREVQKLIDSGNAYLAFDTAEELESMRTRFTTDENKSPKYDSVTRDQMKNSLTLSSQEVDALVNSNTPYVIRLKVPVDQHIEINDIIRGKVVFKSNELDDKVLIKSDGLPTYHLANVVDDILMEISHVVRGEEWLSSTAHHFLLYKYFGWQDQMPQFAHLPLILKPNGQGKLSKRDGAQFGFPVFPLQWNNAEEKLLGFREFGFLPEAVLNFLALLGWNSGTEQEIFSLDELIEKFSLDQISKSGARFDFEKAKWFNTQYIQSSSPEHIQNCINEFYNLHNIKLNEEQLLNIYSLYKDRVQLITDFYTNGAYLVSNKLNYNSEFLEKKWNLHWLPKYQLLSKTLLNVQEWSKPNLEMILKEFMESEQLKMGEVLPTLRVILSGIPTGPDIYAMLLVLGKSEVVERLNLFLMRQS